MPNVFKLSADRETESAIVALLSGRSIPLTTNQSRLHNDKYERERKAIERINGMTPEEFAACDRDFELKFRTHYMALQIDWFITEKYLLGEEVHHDPTDEKIGAHLSQSNNAERYRAFYIMFYPHMVKKK